MHATLRCREVEGLRMKFARGPVVLVFMGLLAVSLAAQDMPPWGGFDHFYNLEYDQALAEFEKASRQDPSAIGPHNHIAQTLLYREMYRNGALETQLVSGNNPFLRQKKLNPSPQVEKQFSDEIQKAIDLANARLASNANDTGALYAGAESLARFAARCHRRSQGLQSRHRARSRQL